MKKFLSVCLTLVVALGMIGCGNVKSPEYTSDEKFDIGMWVGVSDKVIEYNDDGKKTDERFLTDEEFLAAYRDIADSGINIAFPGYDKMTDGTGNDYNKKALKAAKTVGIKHIIADNNLRVLLNSAKSDVENGVKTREQIVTHAKEIVDGYKNSEGGDALYGFMIKDEPGANLYDSLAYGAEILKEAAPDVMFYVNLFPVIATRTDLSGTATSMQYSSYLSQYFQKIKTDYVSYDHYPLFGTEDLDNPGTFLNYSLEKSFLYNMDLMRTAIRDEGANRKLWTFIQSIQFGSKNRRLISKADVGFQAYSFLAFGGDGIQWFCYSPPPPNDGSTMFGNNSLVDRQFKKTATFGYVQAVNKEIQALMPYYKNFDWKGIMLSDAYDASGNFDYLTNSENLIESDDTVSKITSTEAAFAGVFEDKNGNRGYMVVNFTEPLDKISNTVTMNISGYKHAIVVKNGKKTVQSIKGGKLKLKMGTGEGYFVIPFN